MHLKNPLLFGLMAILLLGGTITPVLSQSTPDTNIVINEVEMNPSGSDAGYGESGSGVNSKTSEGTSGGMEFVELYNPSSSEIDLGGWSIVPSPVWKTYEIPENTIIGPKSFLLFTHTNFWFKDFGDTVSLYDKNSNLVDVTPLLIDDSDDSNSWQRVFDGLDSDSDSDWEFKRVTPKSTNGSLVENVEKIFTLTGMVDKDSYTLGDYLVISGTVSEELFVEKPVFSAEIIKVTITGEKYYKNIALFPERSLEYSTTLNLQEVYGFSNGDYDIKIIYGDNQVNTSFKINELEESLSTETQVDSLEIFTDKDSYIPGEIVVLSANTNSLIEYGGLEYSITNPDGDIVFEGTIFQNEKFSTVFKQGSGQIFPFSTELFMSTVNPVYGTYQITGLYKSQNPMYDSVEDQLSATHSFDLIQDEKEDVVISLTTDKEIYTFDDTVKVSGRSNDVWTEDLELTVEQTSLFHRTTSTSSDNRSAAMNPFTLQDSVRLDGDGRFSFEFKFVESTMKDEDYSHVYGDYKISVSEYFGNASVIIQVVEDPETFVDVRTPLGLQTDSDEYLLGTPMKISGTVKNYDFKVSNNMRNIVEVKIQDANNQFIAFEDHQGNPDGTNCNTNDCAKYSKPLIFTAIPDSVGNYEIDAILYPGQFSHGSYKIIATHTMGGISESKNFEIVSSFENDDSSTTEKSPLILNLEKDVYYVGEKLLINGNVILKDPRTLDQSSTNTSGQTQSGSSYTTNYAQAAMNYVEVSIPYPQSLIFTKSSAWKTTPNEGENYTGGGGSGAGGSYYRDADGNVVRGDEDQNSSRGDESRATGYDGTAVLQKQKKLLTDMNFKAYPDENGNFQGMFDLRAGVFSSGTYLIKANYYGHYAEQLVTIIDNSLSGGLTPQINLEFDKSEYIPGDTVRISGQIENIYYYDNVSVIIETPDVSKVNCFAGHQCGFGNTEKKLRVQETIEGPQFFMNYKLPETDVAIGEYNVLVDTHFGEAEKQFFVISDLETTRSPVPDNPLSGIKKSIEKFNRIPENEIPITLDEKLSDDTTLVPRVLQGSLFTSARGEESTVNLRISTTDGQCIIGQDSTCLISESTRKPGAIYSVVSIDDVNYKIRYSGNDVRLEKFSIVPEESNSQIEIDNWNVEIIKDEQPSRFYYKVSYVALE